MTTFPFICERLLRALFKLSKPCYNIHVKLISSNFIGAYKISDTDRHMCEGDGGNVPLHLTIKLSPSFHVAIFYSMLSGDFYESTISGITARTAHHSSYLFVCCISKITNSSLTNLKTGWRGCKLVKFLLFITDFMMCKKKKNVEIWLVCEWCETGV